MESKNKSKNDRIKRLMSFTGRSQWLLILARVLSGISAVFILVPFLCVYFAAKELVVAFTGGHMDTDRLLKYGIYALIFELIGLLIYFVALLCSHITAFRTEKNLKMAALKRLAKMPRGYFDTIQAES